MIASPKSIRGTWYELVYIMLTPDGDKSKNETEQCDNCRMDRAEHQYTRRHQGNPQTARLCATCGPLIAASSKQAGGWRRVR